MERGLGKSKAQRQRTERKGHRDRHRLKGRDRERRGTEMRPEMHIERGAWGSRAAAAGSHTALRGASIQLGRRTFLLCSGQSDKGMVPRAARVHG